MMLPLFKTAHALHTLYQSPCPAQRKPRFGMCEQIRPIRTKQVTCQFARLYLDTPRSPEAALYCSLGASSEFLKCAFQILAPLLFLVGIIL